MAYYETSVKADLDEFVAFVEDSLDRQSSSISREYGRDLEIGSSRARFSVFERYSMAGSNRVSLSILFVERDGYVDLTGVSSGGSQAMFWKINTIGEESFLDTLKEAVWEYQNSSGYQQEE